MNISNYKVSLIILVLILSCGKKEFLPEEKILVRIADKMITTDEFVRRAEYVVRPPYCSDDNYIHKKIILNSLIAEKLTALEAGEDNELMRNAEFQDYLRGRKEQAMRQILFDDQIYKKVKLDNDEIQKIYRLAGRKYELSFFAHKDSSVLNEIRNQSQLGDNSFDEIGKACFGLEKAPEKQVSWEDKEEEVVHEALFSESLNKGQIIGPIRTEDQRFLLMQVKGWTDRQAIADTDVQCRRDAVIEALTQKHADALYDAYVAKLMKGKKVQFSQETFYKLIEAIGPVYFKSDKEKNEAFNQRFWEQETLSPQAIDDIASLLDQPFLSINGDVWTVRDFQKELNAHPLVFRKRRMEQTEFAEQFKLAVVDLIRDKYITADAYKKGLDRSEEVKASVGMWRDNLLSMYQQNQYLRSIQAQGGDYYNTIRNYLSPYIDSLQIKYSDRIEINTDAFEKIKLTSIDMFVLQRNMPFPIIVPSFPLLTTDDKLDYGMKMK